MEQRTWVHLIELKGLKAHFYVLMTLWAFTICGLLWWDISDIREGTRRRASFVANAHFDKDQAFRLWATSHGGVYVPIDDKTRPNPHLGQIEERDISTPSGVKLTLMNPAYMLRQLHEESDGLYGVKG
ncbi:MAG: ATPase, partial [Desulfomonile tiedjei]|nr:ATPase [Desulfomonile tiedjei]